MSARTQAGQARAAAERRAEVADRAAGEERGRATTMAELLGQAQHHEAAARHQATQPNSAPASWQHPASRKAAARPTDADSSGPRPATGGGGSG